MDELYGISLRGNVKELTKWRDENPHLPLNPTFTAHRRTPLHIAAMCGHVKFADKLSSIDIDGQLTTERDLHGFTPLHLASARPSLSMVKKLLEANTDVCMYTDDDGRTPLYLAAMGDRYKIVEVLIKKKPEALNIRCAQNDTILHHCVKHGSLKSLKLLMAKELSNGDALSMNMDAISVNSKDDDGNTILHLAASMNQVEFVKFLVESKNTGIDLNALNNNKTKALHMLTQTERDTFDIGCFHFKKKKEIPEEWLKERVSALMVVATLIAGIAFQAAINPPGGIFQDDSYVNSRENPVTFTYYLGSVDGSSLSTRFVDYLSRLINLPPNDIHAQQQNATKSYNSTKIIKTATFVRNLLETLKNDSYASGNSYVESKSPGIVLEHEKWNPIISEHNRNANFTPYLIRYAGTPILAYAHPRIYFVYIICNAVSFLISVSIIMIVITGPVYEKSIHQQVKVLVWMLFFSITVWIGSYIAVFISMSPPFYKIQKILLRSSYGGIVILLVCMCGYLIRLKLKYWKQMILLHILKKEILVDQLYKENTELFERAFLIRFLAVLYLFGLATLLLYTLFE